MDVGGAQWLSGRMFDTRLRRCRHCVVFLSKTHDPFYSTGSTEEACTGITGKLLTQTFRVKLNKQIINRCLFIKYALKKNVVSHL